MKNNNFDLTAFDSIKFDFTGKKTRAATIEALKAIQAENDTNKKWGLIRDLAIALSCSAATIVAWIWPNKKAINKQIRRYDEGEFLWQSEFYTNTQMMNMGLYTEYAAKCAKVAETVKAIEDATKVTVAKDAVYKTEEEKTNAIKALNEKLKTLKEERDAIRKNPNYKGDKKEKKEKKEKKNKDK
jgi:hypothetical protein